jgi:hypothetical protein
MINTASMETSALIDMTIALVDELIRRDKSAPAHLFAVDGVHTDAGPQVTGDFVVATNEEQATLRVGGVRRLCSDGWTHDTTRLHLENIKRSILALEISPVAHATDLEAMLNEFGGARCLTCQKPFNEFDLDRDGRCGDCRTPPGTDGIL